MRTTSGYDWIWRPTRFAVFERDAWTCLCCGARVSWTGNRKGPTLDHVVPLSAGGSNDPSNLVTLCRGCNTAKGARDSDEWRMSVVVLGVDPEAYRARVKAALARPIDPERGRELCELYCPGWLDRKRAKNRRYRKQTPLVEVPF